MLWPFNSRPVANYWLKVFAWYALTEACIQLMFLFILNNFGTRQISNWEFHLIMWVFQCVLVWPIWWMAHLVSEKSILVQVLTAVGFYLLYSWFWFGPVQEAVYVVHTKLQEVTRPLDERIAGYVDRASDYSYINYQLLKHSFRLSWFFLANYFYHYRLEEKKRIELAVANKELQLKLLKWHLNPDFYFKTIDHLRNIAAEKPMNCTGPILQLARVMEYVIYEAKEKLIDVKKEIQFLQNYIHLVSSQSPSGAKFQLQTRGDYEKLKIAPLLIAAFIDKISSANDTGNGQAYQLLLNFNGDEMQLVVKEESSSLNLHAEALKESDPAIVRLKELYPQKYELVPASHQESFHLKVKLDDY